MNFTEAVGSGFRNYVNFSTRAIRSEYWYWTLFVVLVSIVSGVIDWTIVPGAKVGPVGAITSLALLLPGIAVSVRRLHDRDYSGWWVLLAFVPLVGWIILLVWFVMRGTVGDNRFGPDPLQGRM